MFRTPAPFRSRPRPVVRALGVYACWLVLLTASPGFGQLFPRSVPLPAPVPTTARDFSIPFEMRPDGSADPVNEVELLVSKDNGVRWHSVGRLPVNGKKFDFHADADGEYWFAFRTITLSGQTKQVGQGTPRIRVLVDSTAPELSLQAAQQPSGQVLVHWKVRDRQLQGKRPDFSVAAASFDDKTVWTPLNVDGRHQQASTEGAEGRFLFWPENGVAELLLRASIADIAGNREEKTLTVKLTPVQRTLEDILRDAAAAEPDSIASPNAPAASMAPQQSGPNAQTGPERPQTTAVTPLTPPRPMRMTREKPKQAAQTVAKATPPKKEVEPPAADTAPLLGSPSGEIAPSAASWPETGFEQANVGAEKRPEAESAEPSALDPLRRRLLVNMDRFFDGRLADTLTEAETKAAEPNPESVSRQLADGPAFPALRPLLSPSPSSNPQPSPARPHARIAENKGAPPPASATTGPVRTPAGVPAKVVSPGNITGVSLNTAAEQPQIIVKWHPGDALWTGAQVDVLRGKTLQGPWMPIATHLANTGEYWWFLTPVDREPFHVMVRLRAPLGDIKTDATQTPIVIAR